MPKRSSYSSSEQSDSEAPAPCGSSPITSDYEVDTKHSPSKKAKTTNAKAKKESSESPKGKQVKTAWTADEDAIFWSVIDEHLKKTLWGAIKEDGRLEYRGAPGIWAHRIAMMNKVKKA